MASADGLPANETISWHQALSAMLSSVKASREAKAARLAHLKSRFRQAVRKTRPRFALARPKVPLPKGDITSELKLITPLQLKQLTIAKDAVLEAVFPHVTRWIAALKNGLRIGGEKLMPFMERIWKLVRDFAQSWIEDLAPNIVIYIASLAFWAVGLGTAPAGLIPSLLLGNKSFQQFATEFVEGLKSWAYAWLKEDASWKEMLMKWLTYVWEKIKPNVRSWISKLSSRLVRRPSQ